MNASVIGWGAAARADGSIVVAGSTEGDWNGDLVGTRDFMAVALDDDGEELWRWQVCLSKCLDLCGAGMSNPFLPSNLGLVYTESVLPVSGLENKSVPFYHDDDPLFMVTTVMLTINRTAFREMTALLLASQLSGMSLLCWWDTLKEATPAKIKEEGISSPSS